MSTRRAYFADFGPDVGPKRSGSKDPVSNSTPNEQVAEPPGPPRHTYRRQGAIKRSRPCRERVDDCDDSLDDTGFFEAVLMQDTDRKANKFY